MLSVTGKVWRIKSEARQGTLLQRVLSHRELDRLNGTLEDLHSPYLLKDMQKAADIICNVLQVNGKIMIFGDYDVDGVVSSSVLYQVLKDLGANVSVRLPNRFTDGYGLNKDFIEECKDLGVDLIITVDCGSSNLKEVALAKTHGMRVIITDHHHVPDILPFADAVINPHRKDCTYPDKRLAGAGVAFKLCQVLVERCKKDRDFIYDYLDLVALATTADCMPILGENRILVKYGLEKLRETKHKGLRALMKHCDIDTARLSTYTFGFQLGPPLNAAGRLESPLDAFYLLIGKEDVAQKLYQLNTERQRMVKNALEEAETMLGEVKNDKKILIVGSEEWGLGVVGLIAGKLTEKYHRPAIVFTQRGNDLVASARSTGDYSIIDALTRHKHLFMTFGGHKQAAGFATDPKNLDELITRLESDACKYISNGDLLPVLHIDTELLPDEISFESFEQLKKLEPFGMGNVTPLFRLSNVRISGLKRIGINGSHVNFDVTAGSYTLRAVAFGFGEHFDIIASSKNAQLAVTLNVNEWKNQQHLQLVVKDMML